MKTNNYIGPKAPSLFIMACHIGVLRLGSVASDLREELYHRPEVPTTTTYDALSPPPLLFILLFAIGIKLQHTASTNMPNGSFCSSQHKWYNAHVLPSSSVNQNVTTQMPKIDVTNQHLLYDIPRYATYSPQTANVSTMSAQLQTAAVKRLLLTIAGDTLPSSLAHNGTALLQYIGTTVVDMFLPENGVPPSGVNGTAQWMIKPNTLCDHHLCSHNMQCYSSATKHLKDYYSYATRFCFTIPVSNGIIPSSIVPNGTTFLQNIGTTRVHPISMVHPFLSTTDVPHLFSNYDAIDQLSRTTTSDVHSLSAADAGAIAIVPPPDLIYDLHSCINVQCWSNYCITKPAIMYCQHSDGSCYNYIHVKTSNAI